LVPRGRRLDGRSPTEPSWISEEKETQRVPEESVLNERRERKMIRFTKNGETLFTESDNGELIVKDMKLAEAFKEAGVSVKEDKEEDKK
jgi:hypothetical protein